MTHDQSYPATEGANWTLHRQPADQIVDHKFSIWSGEHPVVLANEMPGEEGALAYIVDVLNRGPTVLAQRSPRLRKAEADGGFNIIIDDTWAAFFPKASEAQIDFLIDRVSASLGHRCDDGSKAFPVSSETSVPASPPGGSGAENPTASSASSTHEPSQPASEPRAWTVLHKSGATIWKLLEDKLSADYWRTQGFPVEALYADSPVLEQLRSILANRVDPDWKVLTAARHALALSSTHEPAQGSGDCGVWRPSAEAIAAVIDPVAFDPISLVDTHPSWEWRRETARATAAEILALGPSVSSTYRDAGK